MYPIPPPAPPPRPPEPAGYSARNSLALLVCSAFLVAVGATKGVGVAVTVMLVAAILALVGLVLTVVALARSRIAAGILLLLGWLVFLPLGSYVALIYAAQITARSPPQPVAADASLWAHWIYGVESGFRRAIAQNAAAQRALARKAPTLVQTLSSPPPPAATPAPAATPEPSRRPEQDFATAVEESKRRAIRRYPDLAVAGSELNRAFIAEYNRLNAQHSSDLLLVTWPETLADQCAHKNARVSRR